MQRTKSPLRGLRVLAVDDEPDSLDLLETALEFQGSQVMTATNVRDALRLLRERRPDVLVSDIGMPDEDGHALIRQVRALPPEQGGTTPAIALTAFARPQDEVRALAAGFDRYLTKPLDLGRLFDVLAALRRG